MLSGRSTILMAAFLGSISVNIPSLFQSYGVKAMWCWKRDGSSTSTLMGCNSLADMGSGNCLMREECCDDYVCWQANQCVGGVANADGSNGILSGGEESDTRTKGLKDSASCAAPAGTNNGANGTNSTNATNNGNTATNDAATNGTTTAPSAKQSTASNSQTTVISIGIVIVATLSMSGA